MSKMSELSVLLDEIINTGSSLLKALTAVRELVASLEDKDLKVIDVPEQKAIEAPKPAAKAKAKKEGMELQHRMYLIEKLLRHVF